MRLDGAKKWYAAAALASVLVLVAGWFLLVSPQRQNADAIGAQADSQLAQNQVTQAKIDQLKAEYTNMPALQQQLALLQTHMPQTPNMPALLRSLSQAATSAGVKLLSVTPSTPTPLAGTSPAQGAPAQGAAAALATPGQVDVVGVALQISGPFANTRLFLSSLEAMPRSYLVTGLSITRANASSATTVAPGTLMTTVTGRVFTANPTLTAAAATSTSGSAAGAATNG